MKVLDLFCGAGGLSLGFTRASFLTYGIDIDEACCRTYALNRMACRISDVRFLDPNEFDWADVIIGSPPCKSFSFVSQRRHKPEPENDLIFEFARFVESIKPLAFVFENVVGLRVGWRKRLVYELKRRLQRAGYNVIDVVLDAYDFGTPQHRRRLFLIGTTKPKFLSLKHRKGRTVREAFRDVQKAPNHVWTQSEKALDVMPYIPQGKSLCRVWKDLPERLQARYSSFANMHNNIYHRLAWDEPSITICHPRKAMILHPEEDRVISVREAARLQGFPDDFRFHGSLDKQYQMVADAVPPPLAEAIATFVKE